MPDVNSDIVTRFRNGGSITIGGNTVANIVNGSLRLEIGGRTSIIDRNGSEMAADVREGDAQPSYATLRCKMTDAIDLYTALTAEGTDGNKPKLPMVITRPGFRNSTSGKRLTLTNAVLEGGLSINEGEEYDEVEFRLLVTDHRPQWVAYTP